MMCYDFFYMVSFRQRHGLYFKPRLKRLQDMQAEIYRQLQLLMPEHVAYHDSFQSRVSGSPLLKLDILERHTYTQFLRLTYQFNYAGEKEMAPDAHIRLYRDARLAEVTAFNPRQGCRRLAHPNIPHHQLLQRSWHQNLALDKWLNYLLQQGHNVASMLPASKKVRGGQALSLVRALS